MPKKGPDKNMRGNKRSGKPKPVSNEKDSKVTTLELLAARRSGGANNFGGIAFQLLYSCFLILTRVESEGQKVRLEGVEDIDFLGEIDNAEYIQLKTSKNTIGASNLWEMNVLQNFLEAYKIDPHAKFKLVHNSSFSDGKLRGLFDRSYTSETLQYWKNRFNENSLDLNGVDFSDFLSAITIEKSNEIELLNRCLKILSIRYGVNLGTEKQYFNALFEGVFQWSKNRSTISKRDIDELIALTTESFSKAPVNPAIQNNWLSSVIFEPTDSPTIMDYFDGKAAKPAHIANNLPVKRPLWEKEILDSIIHFDVTLIRASSGQGKSTLAWQTSYNLLAKGYTVFQLNYCKDWDQVAQICDLIESRIRIGQLPLIVIDGLGYMVESWGTLTEKLKDRPVKFLITAREEDWVRYGYDLSKIKIKPIQIKLSQQEAQEIYVQLKEKGKINSDNLGWQQAWEKVEAKGLLIEYVYLLTRGQMLAERLQEQVRQLAEDKSNGVAKAEILRLIALADIMDIRLQTKKITKYITDTVKFDSDRNEVYRQLEQEYYIRFDEQYIEGLHPVRSQHLVAILHSSIQISETLLPLFSIINSEYIFEFFRAVPTLISVSEKDEVYDEIATVLVEREIVDLVHAMDGLMKYEAERFWFNNRTTFDHISLSETALVEIFIYDTLPCMKLRTLKTLRETHDGDRSKYDEMIRLLDGLIPFDVAKTDIFTFIKKLSLKLQPIDSRKCLKGLGFLARWFKFFDVEMPVLISTTEDMLLNALKNKGIEEASELFVYHQIVFPENYKRFTIDHKREMICWLKKYTDTLTIQEDGDNIQIKYFLDTEVEKAHDQSMKRLDVLKRFLPDYSYYCSEAVVLPFPYKEIFDVVIQDSVKKISKANLGDQFDIHINQIWHAAIFANYRVGSLYEWQIQYVEIRQLAIEIAKQSVKLFEAHVEQNQSKIRSAVREWRVTVNQLLNKLKTSKKLPKYNRDYFREDKYKAEEKAIRDWCSSLANFVNQMSGIIAPMGNNDRNLATVNLKAVEYDLPVMQSAYRKITEETFDYHSTDSLCSIELTQYKRLVKTVLFYVHRVETKSTERIFIVKNDIEQWYENNKKQKLEQLHSIINQVTDEGFSFILPDAIIEIENLKYAEIGIEGADLTDLSRDLEALITGLVDLDRTEIDFFTFVFISQGEAVYGLRFTRHYFHAIRIAFETGEFNKNDVSNPLPMFGDILSVSSLPGIKVQKVNPDSRAKAFFEIMQLLGKFLNYKECLDTNSPVELVWLKDIEGKYRSRIGEIIDLAKSNVSQNDAEILDKYIDECFGVSDITTQAIVDFMNYRLKSITKQQFG